MTESLLNYFIVGLLGLLAVFAFAIGTEQMIKIVIGNYLLSTICLACATSLDIFTRRLAQGGNESFALGMTYLQGATLINDGKTTIVLVLYGLLLIYIFRNSKISIHLPNDELLSQVLYTILIPLTVLSAILSLEVAILGTSILDVNSLMSFAKNITTNTYIANFIVLTPVWLLIHGLMTVYLTSEIKITYHNPLN